jgi:multiple sugar transport system ATP-binding protein
MAQISFENVSKTYNDGHRAVSSLNLSIDDGEFIVLVGPSGCGKSTALRMVAGLEDISEGQIRVGGAVANDLSPRDRNIAMVFQSYALYPHLTVAENIGFGLKVRGMAKAEIARKVVDAARTLELSDYLSKKPAQLSGGQRQRVAMGRALVREPNAFLMDEPLSNLDARLRVLMRAEIARLQKMTGVTTLYVTHDQVEAMTMGDRVAVMDRGVLQQFAPPRVLYHEPANLFVANFIGSPAINLLEGKIVSDPPGLALSIGGARFSLPAAFLDRAPAAGDYVGRSVVVGVRPESLAISAIADPSGGALRGAVAFVEDLGASLLLHLDVDAPRPRIEGADSEGREFAEPGDRARLRTAVGGFAEFRTGDPIAVALDFERIHLFDPRSGLAIGARRG